MGIEIGINTKEKRTIFKQSEFLNHFDNCNCIKIYKMKFAATKCYQFTKNRCNKTYILLFFLTQTSQSLVETSFY